MSELQGDKVKQVNGTAFVLYVGLACMTALAAPGHSQNGSRGLEKQRTPKPAPPPKASPAPAFAARDIEFFESKIRPLLSEHCLSCHSGPRLPGKLDLESRASMLKGGVLGSSVVPHDPDGSILIRAVQYDGRLKMPPQGKLSDQQIQDLTQWVKQGAAWPAVQRPGTRDEGREIRSGQLATSHWAFQPVRVPKIPAVRNQAWVKNPIDAFVLAKLEAKGWKPNPPASRPVLIRRATFDLTGLPPTPDEIDAFVNDPRSDAWARVVDRLLASPHYGERWGRHWLDVVRYADSNGRDWNEVFSHAWRYRDYVIRSFNEDKPYDQFVREQLAGDLMAEGQGSEIGKGGPLAPSREEFLIATGMLVMGPKLLAQQDRIQLALDVVDEQIDVTSKAFLGLTVSCARCHDHKFDPISTRDYYSLAGVFKSTKTFNGTLTRNDRVMYWMERPITSPDKVEAWKSHQEAVQKLEAATKKTKDETEKKKLDADLKALKANAPPPPPMAMAVEEGKPETMRVHRRGSYQHLGDIAPHGVPVVLAGPSPPTFSDNQSGRLELAGWIASKDNPLTSRVLVNRVWHHHFGRGLVRTVDNFGTQGELPTHPELLDWLASCFASGRMEEWKSGSADPSARPLVRSSTQSSTAWSLKSLHRLIMLSSTYRMSSESQPVMVSKDPDNRWLWGARPRRLEAEAIRDAMLAVSGQLDRAVGGSLLTLNVGFPGDETRAVYSKPRRSVYLPVVRDAVCDILQAFDFADPNIVTGQRDVTTVAPQALVMLNSPFVIDQSSAFAQRLLVEAVDDAQRVRRAYLLAYGRLPSPEELGRALAYLERAAGSEAPGAKSRVRGVASNEQGPESKESERQDRWQRFCQALFGSTEFRYAD